MKKTNWLAIGTIGVLALIVLFWIGTWIGGGFGGYGMMGGYGGHMAWGYSPSGWIGMGFGMLFMWLIPIGIIALIVYGVVALTKNIGNSNQVSSSASCSNCSKGIQPDWQNCPYCGMTLK